MGEKYKNISVSVRINKLDEKIGECKGKGHDKNIELYDIENSLRFKHEEILYFGNSPCEENSIPTL
jgi:hypothetical protein